MNPTLQHRNCGHLVKKNSRPHSFIPNTRTRCYRESIAERVTHRARPNLRRRGRCKESWGAGEEQGSVGEGSTGRPRSLTHHLTIWTCNPDATLRTNSNVVVPGWEGGETEGIIYERMQNTRYCARLGNIAPSRGSTSPQSRGSSTCAQAIRGFRPKPHQN